MNIKGCTSLLLPLCACIGLSACDIGPSGLSSGFEEIAGNIQSSSSSSPGETILLSGTVSKGLILNGVVNIHPIMSGVVSPTPIASTTTGTADGTYDVTIDNYYGNPLLIQVRTTTETHMICDLPTGCGDDADFGTSYSFHDPDFHLEAVTPPITTVSTQVNASMLTHVAAQVARRNIATATDTTSSGIGEILSRSNAEVASRFGLLGSLTRLPIIDITNPAVLVDLPSPAIEYNLLNSAAVHSMRLGVPGQSIAEATNQFAQQYADNQGIADREESQTAAVTVAEILAQANGIINRIKERDTENTLNLNALQSTIQANRQLAETGSTEPTTGVVVDTPDLAPLGKVKAMVGEMRKVGTAIEDGFDAEQALIENALDADAGHAMSALAMGMEAIGDAIVAYDADNAIEQYEHVDSGLTVTITSVDDVVLYEIEDTLDEGQPEWTTIDLSAADSGSTVVTTEDETSGSATADVELSITGTVESAAVILEIEDGNVTLANFSGAFEETVEGTTTTEVIETTFDEMRFDLDVVLTEGADATDPVSFSGALGFNIQGADLSDTATEIFDQGQYLEEFVTELATDNLEVYLSGAFSRASGSLVTASLAVNADVTGYDPNVEESASNYVDLSFTIVFQVPELGDIDSPTTVTLSGTRDTLDQATVDVQIRYGAVILRSSHTAVDDETDNDTLVVTDQNEVVLTITENADEYSGNITLEGTQYAEIEMVNDIPTVSYIDGQNESLF